MPRDIDPENDSLEAYFSYTRLRVRSLAQFSTQLADLAETILVIHSEIVATPVSQLSSLEIDSLRTGESIKFKFNETWMPSITSDATSDIVIGVPRKLGIPLVIGSLLLTGAKQLLDIRNTQLDNELKSLEIKIKQSELQKTTLASSAAEERLRSDAAKIIVSIYQNNDYRKFEVNGVTIFDHGKENDDFERRER